VPVLSAAEMERMRLADEKYEERYARRLEDQAKIREEERDYRAKLKKEDRDRLDNSRLRNPAFERLLASELEIEQAAIMRDASDPNLSDDQKEARSRRVVAVAALSRQLYAGGYYTHGRVVTQNENLFDTSKAIYDLLEGDDRIVSLSSSEIKQLNEMGLKEYLEYRKRGGQPDQPEGERSETIVRPEDEVTRGPIDQGRSAVTDTSDEGALAAAKIAADEQAAEEEAARKKAEAEAEAKAAAAMVTQQATAVAEPRPKTAADALARFQAGQAILRKQREKAYDQVTKIDQELNRLKSANINDKSVRDKIRDLKKQRLTILKNLAQRMQKNQKPKPAAKEGQKPKVERGAILHGKK
jgi:hypothetical protein